MQTFKFPSRSGDGEHTVTVGANNHVSCTCRGFRTPSKCWHVREIATKLNLPHQAMSNTPALPFVESRPQARVVPFGEAYPEEIDQSTHFVEPMLGRALKEREKLENWLNKAGWSLEEKYNGHRIQIHITPRRIIYAWSRDQNRRELGAHLLNELSAVPAGVYDGELFIPGKNFSDVTRKDLRHRQRLALFDVIAVYDGDTLQYATSRPLHYRRELLKLALSRHNQLDVFQAPIYPVRPDVLQAIWDRGGEGVMLKHEDGLYEPGRRVWIKFKKEQIARITVTGFKEGKQGPHSIICGQDAEGIKVQCKAGLGSMRAAFDKDPDAWIGRTLVIEYQHRTDDGKYWHPRADHFED